jgi:hypothetical protein
MPEPKSTTNDNEIFRDIAAQLEIHAKQELDHALMLSRQIDYFQSEVPRVGGVQTVRRYL